MLLPAVPIKRWGCYKPNTPSRKKDEHPPKVELSIFLLDVSQDIAERIYSKHKVNPTQEDRQSGFWYCVWKHNIPCALAEGAKKAASLLSQGHAAIGLPGISAGYRTPKDEFGKKIGKSYLHEELAVFATPSREIKFCFDYETKPETKLNIERDISVTGRLLQKSGAKVKVVSLPGPDKGVDDFIVARGPLAYEKLSHQAMNLRDWQRQNQYKSAATISPPQKLTPEQRSLQQNQSIGQTDDINRQQPKTDTGISSVNRENREIVEQSRETESGIERKNPTFGTEPSRDNEELLAAISRDIELQEIEQLGDDIARINQSFGGGQGTNQQTDANSEFTKIVTNVVAIIDKLSECLKQKTAGAVEEKEQVTTNIKSLLKQMLQHLDKQQMSDLFIEVGKYAQGEKVKADQVNKLFYPVGQADLSLTFEQKMNMVRQLIREDKARIMILLEIPQSHESKQSRFRR